MFISLNSSGTEEQYSELCQLLEDISSYLRDLAIQHKKDKAEKKKKDLEDKMKAQDMRKAAMEGISSKKLQ